MTKFQITYGLAHYFQKTTTEIVECESLEVALDIAYQYACDDFEEIADCGHKIEECIHYSAEPLSDISKAFLYCLEKAMGYAYASATEGVKRQDAHNDFKKIREEILVEFQKKIPTSK